MPHLEPHNEQVIIFPLRVNVNLKSLTVEEITARRKVSFF
jgi:hypothetical protein